MFKIIVLSTLLLTITACSTMNDSLKLGAALGAVTGAAATYSAQSATGGPVSGENIALGAGIGLGIGLLTSYVVHRQVESDRQSTDSQYTEMHFGDLPPSPFIMPRVNNKKGGR